MAYGGGESGALATARWADPADIANRYSFKPGDFWVGRNPHNFNDAIGVKLDSHVFMCASSGAGKGRSILVNNVALYPGSVVVYDPKGDLPRICAPARGPGDEYCEGLNQNVFVLDPLNHSGCAEEFLAYFDPIAALDPEDDQFRALVEHMARALVKLPEDSNHKEWAERGTSLVALIIEHVVGSKAYAHPEDHHEKNIFTVLRLLKQGRAKEIRETTEKLFKIGRYTEEEYQEKLKKPSDRYIALFEEIRDFATNDYIRDDAEHWLSVYKDTKKFFGNCREEAVKGINWITKAKGMETALNGRRNGRQKLGKDRRFDPRELKQNPKGISVFIVMEADMMELFAPWVQAVFIGIFSAMRRTENHPDIQYPTLGIIDEFSSLGKQEYIVNAFDNIRSRGMRLVIALQNMGHLKQIYGTKMESFIGNCCLKLFFGDPGETASDFLVKSLGQTEIQKFAKAHSQTLTRTEGTSGSKAKSRTYTEATGSSAQHTVGSASSQGGSRQTTDTYSKTDSHSHARSNSQAESLSQANSRSLAKQQSRALQEQRSSNWNEGVNWSNGRNWGEGTGRTMGQNYGPHIFFEGLTHTSNYGSSLNRSKGGNTQRGGTRARGGGTSSGLTETEGTTDTSGITDTRGTTNTHGTTDTIGSSETFGRSVSEGTNWNVTQNESTSTGSSFTASYATGDVHTEGWMQSEAFAEGFTLTEQFHKKPLLEYQEIREFLGPVPDDEEDHPAYPGLLLALIGKEPPVLLRRSNYDQDPFFEGIFSKDPAHPFVTLDDQPMLGYEYTPDHILHLRVPEILFEEGYFGEPMQRPHARFSPGDPLYRIYAPEGGFLSPAGEKISQRVDEWIVHAPCSGRVLDTLRDGEGRFMALRLAQKEPLTSREKLGQFIESQHTQLQEKRSHEEALAQAERNRELAERANALRIEQAAKERFERERQTAEEERLAEIKRQEAEEAQRKRIQADARKRYLEQQLESMGGRYKFVILTAYLFVPSFYICLLALKAANTPGFGFSQGNSGWVIFQSVLFAIVSRWVGDFIFTKLLERWGRHSEFTILDNLRDDLKATGWRQAFTWGWRQKWPLGLVALTIFSLFSYQSMFEAY